MSTSPRGPRRRGAARAKLAIALAFATSALVACAKKEGGSCKGGESSCVGTEAALVCRGEKLVKIACAGPLGCGTFEARARCDDTIGTAGTPCTAEREGSYACSADGKAALTCVNGTFASHLTCLGKAGCSTSSGALVCDASVAERGARCKGPNQLACTPDGKQILVCRSGVFDLQRQCRGERGCAVEDGVARCDDARAAEQDPCIIPGQLVCSIEGDAELVCQGGMFVRSRSCKKRGCKPGDRPGRVACD